jgi:UDP-3-O-[3-hydroxymyristoyl] glucosamine N-acyltransferase
MVLTVAELADRLGAELSGDGSGRISAVGPVEAATSTDVTFIRGSDRYGLPAANGLDAKRLCKLEKSKAGAVIVAKPIAGLAGPQLIVKNVDAALIEALKVLAPELKPPAAGIDPSAQVGENVTIDPSAAVGPNVVVDDGANIGALSVLAGGCKIGQNSMVGRNCRLDGNVVVYHNCTIGDNVIIQANSTIGSTGFGYSLIDGSHRLIPHNGGVIIEDFVEIGANCCVDRAKFGNSVIGTGTKIDNLVQIGHNVVIGKCCLIAGQCAIAGSCKLGDGVVLGGQVGMADNTELGAGVMAGGQSGIINNIPAGQQVLGLPAIGKRERLRIFTITKRLPKLVEDFKRLIKRVDKLEATKDDKK